MQVKEVPVLFFLFAGMVSKELLKQNCTDLLLLKMQETEAAMRDAQESANSNEKSSMGDKYETGRAMGQLERDRLARQLAVLQAEFARLQQVQEQLKHQKVQLGALVRTETNTYWIAVALGQVMIKEEKMMVVSPESPIARQMLGLKKGNSFMLNGKSQKILEIH